jgi:Undecaprenyl-phosphate galactose phosphotransferase WbaP
MSDLVPSARETLKDTLRAPPENLWLAPIRLGKLSIPTRRFIVGATLASADLVASLAAVGLADSATDRGYMVGPPPAVLAVLIFVFYLGLGLYGGCGPSPYERFRLRALGVIAVVTVDLLISVTNGLGIGLLAAISLSGILLLVLGTYTEAIVRGFLIHGKMWGAPVALVGCNPGNCLLAEQLLAEPKLGLKPIGFLESPDDVDRRARPLPVPILGTTRDLLRIGEHAEVVIFAARRQLAAHEAACRGRLPFIQVFVAEEAEDMQSLWLHTRTLGRSIGTEISRGLYVARNLWLKRVIDLLVAVPLGLLALPAIAALALAIKAADAGSAFYIQSRVGRDGRPLRVLKLRTMYCDAERRLEDYLENNPGARAEWRRYFKLSDDPRVLPIIGGFIRRASLDELPQLWNVIRGDMSLVGPRPFPSYHMQSFDPEFRLVRESVPPGLSGLWQVSSRSDGDLDVQKAQDLFYIRNWSIWLDFYIILQTLPAVLMARGAK